MKKEVKIKTPKELLKEQEARNAKEIKSGFLNPFSEGVTYEAFEDARKATKKGISEYCKGKISEDQIEWLVKELKILNK
jgi:hypothetical protein